MHQKISGAVNNMGTTKQVNAQPPQEIPAEKSPVFSRLGFFRSLRKKLGWCLEYLWHLSGSLRMCRGNAILLEGKERQTGELLRVFYFGHGENYDFILKKLFSEYETVEIKRNIFALNVRKLMKKYAGRVDLLFSDVELLYTKMLSHENFLQIPHWIRQEYNVPDSWEGVLQSFRKNTKKTDLRKVRKYNFSYAISTAENDFKEFYHTMHVPYLQKRFDDLVIIEPEGKFLRQCRKGKLMQIIREGEVVAAVLLHMADGRLAYVWVGVPEHIEGDMFDGAFSAMYYFTILYGYLNGCRKIDFLGTRPILNDGLFRYKRKWGTHVMDSPIPRGDILLKPLRLRGVLAHFFADYSFLAREGKGLSGTILCNGGKLNREDMAGLMENYYTNGLKCLNIFCMDGFDADVPEAAREYGDILQLHDLSGLKNPQEVFCGG